MQTVCISIWFRIPSRTKFLKFAKLHTCGLHFNWGLWAKLKCKPNWYYKSFRSNAILFFRSRIFPWLSNNLLSSHDVVKNATSMEFWENFFGSQKIVGWTLKALPDRKNFFIVFKLRLWVLAMAWPQWYPCKVDDQAFFANYHNLAPSILSLISFFSITYVFFQFC